MAFYFKQSMQVEDLQPELRQNNDLYEGRKKLIQNMDLYYDGLELDTPEKKLARWSRTPFYIYYPKIVSSFTSSIFKKPPHYTLPVEDSELKNIDLLGNSLNEYAAQIPLQVLKQGFCATITDYSNKLSRPFLKFINPENFVSFLISNEIGYPVIKRFIYYEYEEKQDESNEFQIDTIKVHYVWDLDNGKVRVRKYTRQDVDNNDLTNYQKKQNNGSDYEDILDKTNYMKINGKNLTTLPIIIHGKESNNYTISKSVLQDTSDLNINVFQRTVDQVEVLHMTAMPTPWGTGIDPEDLNAPKTIGSNKMWLTENQDAKFGLLEFTGEAYSAHEKFIEKLEEAMATSGAQILKRGGISRETATSVLIRTGQETAIITDIVQNISSQIENFLTTYFEWLKKPTKNIEYKLSSDFVNVDMEPNAQIALVKSWLDGAISHKTVFHKMKEGEIIPANKSYEDEMKDIKSDKPSFFSKEKDAELEVEVNSEEDSDSGMAGSNMEIDNGTKNTEI